MPNIFEEVERAARVRVRAQTAEGAGIRARAGGARGGVPAARDGSSGRQAVRRLPLEPQARAHPPQARERAPRARQRAPRPRQRARPRASYDACCASPLPVRRSSRCRRCAALAASRHQLVGVLTQPDRPAGRGRKLRRQPGQAVWRWSSDLPLAQPAQPQEPEQSARACALGERCAGGGGLRPAAAAVRRCAAAPGLSQYSCLAAAALARRGADPARDPGRGSRQRRDASCRWMRARYRRRCSRSGASAIERSTAMPGQLQPQPGGAGAALLLETLTALEAGPRARRGRSPNRAPAMPRRSTSARRASTGGAAPRRFHARCGLSTSGPWPKRAGRTSSCESGRRTLPAHRATTARPARPRRRQVLGLFERCAAGGLR